MASTINAKSTGVGGIDASGDSSGVLELQTGGTTAVTVSTAQIATFVNAPIMGVTGLTGDIAAARITTALNATGSAPIYACRAWVNFNGTGTVAIRASGNVSSITDNGTGDYTINFTTAMPDANYGVSCTNVAFITATTSVGVIGLHSTNSIDASLKTISEVRIANHRSTGVDIDQSDLTCTIFR